MIDLVMLKLLGNAERDLEPAQSAHGRRYEEGLRESALPMKQTKLPNKKQIKKKQL